jgi:hypothetical protein
MPKGSGSRRRPTPHRCPNCAQVMERSGHDNRYRCENCGSVVGPVEDAIRSAVIPGDELTALPGRERFTVDCLTLGGLVLLGGEEASIFFPWSALEHAPDFLRGHGSVLIGRDSMWRSLDEYSKTFSKYASAGYIAAVLEKTGVVIINYVSPMDIVLKRAWK